MLLRFHLPSSLDMPGASLQQQTRLRQVIAQSFERAVTMLNLPSVQIELVQADEEVQVNAVQHESLRSSDGSDLRQAESRDGVEHGRSTRLPATRLYRVESGSFVYAGDYRYREVESFAQAVEQGAALFAHSGYAVVQTRATNRFSVLQLNADEQIPSGSQAGLHMQVGERVQLLGGSASSPQEQVVVAVVEGNRQPFEKRYAIDLMATHNDGKDMIDFIVLMDRALFAEMPWEKRIEYLQLLLHAWTDEREEHALLELLLSTRTGAELEAFFVLLRLQGKHWQLFQELNERTYALLQLRAEYVDDEPPDWRALVSLLLDMKMLPDAPLPVQEGSLQELQEVAYRLQAYLETFAAHPSSRPIFRERDRFIASACAATADGPGWVATLKHSLSTLLWLVELARQDEPWAQMLVTRLVTQAGTDSMGALAGLRSIEELTLPAAVERDNQPGKKREAGESVRGQLRVLLIIDLLTWLREHDVLRLANQGLEGLPQRLAALADVSSLWPEIDIAGMEPNSRERVQRCVSAAQGISAQALKGLQMLLQCSAWNQADVLDVLEHIPTARWNTFLRTIAFINPSSLERWNVSLLQELLAYPMALAFIREAGYDLLQNALTRRGSSWEALDRFLHQLALKREAIGDALAYRWFLYRLEKGETAAFAEVEAEAMHEDQSSSISESGGTQ